MVAEVRANVINQGSEDLHRISLECENCILNWLGERMLARKRGGTSSCRLRKKSASSWSEAVAQSRIAKKSSSGSTKAHPTSQKAKAASSPKIMHVFVTNRLGSRFDIPYCPSDSIGDFKALVAVYSGTSAEMILLRRQGMRPFLNKLTLGDYEIRNRASLDVEIDTMD